MEFKIAEVPVAKARHRWRKMGKIMGTYDPQSNVKNASKEWFTEEMEAKGFLKASDGALHVDLCLGIPIPRSWSQKKRKQALGAYCTKRPDSDNYQKFYFDVMNGICYHDDSQISSIACQKVYSETPYVNINLYPIGQDMIHEHAITVRDEIKMSDVDYLVKKANRLGKSGRTVQAVYCQEDNEGRHIYFETEPLVPKK